MLDRDYLDGLIEKLPYSQGGVGFWERIGAERLRDAILAAPEPPVNGDLISRKETIELLVGERKTHEQENVPQYDLGLRLAVNIIAAIPIRAAFEPSSAPAPTWTPPIYEPQKGPLREALKRIAQYDPRWKGMHVNDMPSRAQLIEIAFDALSTVPEPPTDDFLTRQIFSAAETPTDGDLYREWKSLDQQFQQTLSKFVDRYQQNWGKRDNATTGERIPIVAQDCIKAARAFIESLGGTALDDKGGR